MNDTVDTKKTKERSPNFPFINLDRAIDRARQFYAEEKRGASPFGRAVMHWKYSETSSGALQTVSALKSYGLLTELPKVNSQRQVQLTDLALRIILDQRPDSPERLGFIRQAARSPALAAEVYAKWDGLPSDSTLNHFLVLDKKFNEATAVSVVRILKENQELARLEESSGQSSGGEVEGDFALASDFDDLSGEGGDMPAMKMALPERPRYYGGGAVTPANGAAAQLAQAAGTGRGASWLKVGRVDAHATTEITERLLSLDGAVTTTLHFSDKPSAAVYKWIAVYANLKAEELAKREEAEAARKQADPDIEDLA